MAQRLPDATSLDIRPAPANSPALRVGAIDTQSQVAASKSVAEGLRAISGGLDAAVAADNEINDYDTKKKLLDFKLQSEMALEDHKRTMEPGAPGFSATWQQKYNGMARDFFGKSGSNIPPEQRQKVDLALVQHNTVLSERAQRSEMAERDRYHVEGLGTSVNRIVDAVQANPDNLDNHRREGQQLIDLSPISPAAKAKVKTDFLRATAETAFKERVARAAAIPDPAKRIETIESLRRDLKAHLEDIPEVTTSGPLSGNYADAIKQSEGFTPKAQWDYKQNSNGYGTRAKFPGEVIDKAEAEKRFAEETGKAAEIVDRFAPGLTTGTRAALISLTFNAGDAWTRAGLGEAVKAGDANAIKDRFLQYKKAGGEDDPGLIARREREAQWIGEGEPYQPQTTTQLPVQRPEGSTDPEAMGGVPSGPQYGVYDGPYQGLKAAERRKLDRHAAEQLKTSLFAQHAEFKQMLDDDVRSTRETGVGRRDLDVDLAKKVLTPNQFREYQLRKSAAVYEHDLRGGIEDMPLEDIRQRLKSMKPAEGTEEYGLRSIAYNRTIAKVNQLRQMREKDPAGAIDRTAEVEAARETKDPHAIMDARISKQVKIGVPEQRQSPITREEAQALAAPLAGYKGAEIAKPLQDLSQQVLKQYGQHAPGALRMIARVITQDREAQDIMTGEMEKMTRRPGMEVFNPRRLRELEEINRLEMRRRPTPETSVGQYGPPVPAQASQQALQHLMQNPHLAPFFDQKYGLAPGTAQKYLDKAQAQ